MIVAKEQIAINDRAYRKKPIDRNNQSSNYVNFWNYYVLILSFFGVACWQGE